MSKRPKLIAIACSVLLAAITAFFLYRYITYPLSRKKLQIAMHDPARLRPEPIVEREWVGCTIQIPKEFESKYAGAAISAKTRNAEVYVSTNEQAPGSELKFEPYVIQERKNLLNGIEKPVIDEEGFTKIDGHLAYVMTYHFEHALTHVAIKTREAYVEGFHDKTYIVRFACDMDQWNSYADVFDSSLSTLHVIDSGPKRKLLDVKPF